MSTWQAGATSKLGISSRLDDVTEKRKSSEMSSVYRILRQWVISLLGRYVFDAGKSWCRYGE